MRKQERVEEDRVKLNGFLGGEGLLLRGYVMDGKWRGGSERTVGRVGGSSGRRSPVRHGCRIRWMRVR